MHEALWMLREKSTDLLKILISVTRAMLFAVLGKKFDGFMAHSEQEVKFRARNRSNSFV